MRSSPEGFGSTETPLGGWGIFGFPVCKSGERSPKGTSLPLRPCQVGLRAGGNKVRRPPGRRSRRCEAASRGRRLSGTTSIVERGRQASSETVPSGTGGRVALQVPAFGREGVGRSSAPPFRQGRLPFPVSGSRPNRDRASSARKLREGLTGRRRCPRGRRRRPAEAARERRLGRDLEKTEGQLRAALRPDGIPRDPARAPGTALRPSSEACLARRRRGRMSESRPQNERPDPVSSLPSGRSAFSLRRIGHARPGIRARKLVKSPSPPRSR